MSLQHGWKRTLSVALTFVAVWLCLRYLFPLFLPFLLGFSVALTVGLFTLTEPVLTLGFRELRSRAETAGRAMQKAAQTAMMALFMMNWC